MVNINRVLDKNKAFSIDCKIYNWKELNKKYKLKAKNDAELIRLLIDKKGIDKIEEALKELDGVYAFCYIKDGKVVVARDLIGVKPMWYSHSDCFNFAFEKKMLNILNTIELNPRKILIYDIEKNKIEFIERGFFKIRPEIGLNKKEIIKRLIKLTEKAVEKRVSNKKIGLLFSGGIDSSLIALILRKMKVDFVCYTAFIKSENMKEAEDLFYARKAAKILKLKLKEVEIKEKDAAKYLKNIVPIIEDSNVVKVGVALPLFVACEQAKKDKCKLIFSGLGSEEIFAGYERHRNSPDLNKECVLGLLKMYERDLYRDYKITKSNNLELKTPFLDTGLVKFALKIPGQYKIKDEQTKVILREAAIELGLEKEIAMRKKRAAQYGSNSHKILEKLSKRGKFRYISEYLRQFYPGRSIKLGALVSSGKDSIYAMHVMQKQSYKISCLISVKSENKDSFMFHTPSVELVELQSKAFGIPLVKETTKGKKEAELRDLKKAMEKAKEKYKIQGVVTGALFSNYQRERIEKIADSLGLKVFSPLWHTNQETEVREILDKSFKFIITKIAAEGLDKSFMGREFDESMLNKLVKLNEKIGFNIAGEGGEYETLMIDGPCFGKKIKIEKSSIKQESENVAELVIEKAVLVDK